MRKTMTYAGLLLVLFAVVFQAGGLEAKITEPYVVIYGIARDNGVELSAGTVTIVINSDVTPIASSRVGADHKFTLKVPIDSLDPRLPNTARPEDSAGIYVNGTLAARLIMPGRGTFLNLAADTDFSNDANHNGIPDLWEKLYPGDNGSGDINGNGITDLQEWLEGRDPAGCVWIIADALHFETCVFHPLVLQNCLKDAEGDQAHNLVRVVEGTYPGNFAFAAQWEENFDLELVGGFAGCAERSMYPIKSILDGSGGGTALSLDTRSARTMGKLRVEGLRIQNGAKTLTAPGGGLRASAYDGAVEIIGNMITGNASDAGGGVSVESNSGTVYAANNIIFGNSAVDGGGVSIGTASGRVDLINNTIADNTASGNGGGVLLETADVAASASIINNIIYGNAAAADLFIETNGLDNALGVLNNDLSTYVASAPSFVLDGSNLDLDPMFADAAGGNYHLEGSSPVIDMGKDDLAGFPPLLFDIDGNDRILRAATDIGADEVVDLLTVTITSAVSNPANIPLIPVVVTFNRPVTGFTASSLLTVNDGGVSDFAGGGAVYTFNLTLTADQAVTVDVPAGSAVDEGGLYNEAAVRFVMVYDTIRPAVAISSPVAGLTNISPMPITAIFNEAVADFTIGKIIIANGTALNFAGSGATYTFDVAPAANGLVTVDIAGDTVHDLAGYGNIGAVPLERTYDGTKPSSAVISPLNNIIMGMTGALNGTASDIGSSVQKVEISFNGTDWYSATGTTSWSYIWTVPSDGLYTLLSRATDTAGNIEVPGAGTTITAYKRTPSATAVVGRQLLLNGLPFTIRGVNYSPVPIGESPSDPPYGDYFTAGYEGIYNRDLPLLRGLGANTVLLRTWDNTADHHDFMDKIYNGGVNPVYLIPTYWLSAGRDIEDLTERGLIKEDFRQMVAAHKNHPAVLMWVIGEDLNAPWMYGSNLSGIMTLLDEMAAVAHTEEGSARHPVAAALADSSLITSISAHDPLAPNLDVWGVSVFRGKTFGTLFDDYRGVSGKPMVILQYGIDAYDNRIQDEYEQSGIARQADYARRLWSEIAYDISNPAGAVSIGGTIRSFTDEWWRGMMFEGPGCADMDPGHQGACGFSATGDPDLYTNEEWWGLLRPVKGADMDVLQKRAAYDVLQDLWGGGNSWLNVTSPNGGEEWPLGSTRSIQWMYGGTPGDKVTIELYRNNLLDLSITPKYAPAPVGTDGRGRYTWTLPMALTPGGDYSVRVTSATNGAFTDTSDLSFTIVEPAIRVTYPSEAEVLTRGSSYQIQWTYTGNPGSSVKIELYEGGVYKNAIASSVPKGTNGSGSYQWTVPPTIAAGGSYRIRVTGTTSGAYFGESGNDFTIQ
ncbi:MAG: Ig-like domain-containing protein [Nitrospirae bacterium]|nr:Ig-like domain-containing protein [Nitrospirota bacterium]